MKKNGKVKIGDWSEDSKNNLEGRGEESSEVESMEKKKEIEEEEN